MSTDDGPDDLSYELNVNGERRTVEGAWLGESLLTVLRERLALPGTKEGCGQGECGVCTVLLDGAPVAACLTPAATVGARAVTTIEGLGERGVPSRVQKALVDGGAVQCGYCIPGLVVSAHALFTGDPAPGEDAVRRAVAGHPCRCAGPAPAVAALCALADEAKAPARGEGSRPEIAREDRPGERTGLFQVVAAPREEGEAKPAPAAEAAAERSGAWPVMSIPSSALKKRRPKEEPEKPDKPAKAEKAQEPVAPVEPVSSTLEFELPVLPEPQAPEQAYDSGTWQQPPGLGDTQVFPAFDSGAWPVVEGAGTGQHAAPEPAVYESGAWPVVEEPSTGQHAAPYESGAWPVVDEPSTGQHAVPYESGAWPVVEEAATGSWPRAVPDQQVYDSGAWPVLPEPQPERQPEPQHEPQPDPPQDPRSAGEPEGTSTGSWRAAPGGGGAGALGLGRAASLRPRAAARPSSAPEDPLGLEPPAPEPPPVHEEPPAAQSASSGSFRVQVQPEPPAPAPVPAQADGRGHPPVDLPEDNPGGWRIVATVEATEPAGTEPVPPQQPRHDPEMHGGSGMRPRAAHKGGAAARTGTFRIVTPLPGDVPTAAAPAEPKPDSSYDASAVPPSPPRSP